MSELKKILYAEDDNDIQVIVQSVFELMGSYELGICNDGIEALNTLENFFPDLILLDVMMPNMDGITVFDTIKNQEKYINYRNIPIVFMTAKSQMNEVEEYIDLGAAGIITKPFDPMELCNQINAIWENHNND